MFNLWMNERWRISSLKEGDRNTEFFHRKAASRAKKNKIKRLTAEDSRYIENKGEMEAMTRSFSQSLYIKDDTVVSDPLIDILQSKATQEMTDMLCKPFSNEEISDA